MLPESLVQLLAAQPMVALFVTIALGLLLGSVRLKGISLGASGVLFVAMVIGHQQVEVPGGVKDVGVVLFAYAIGLQAGPRFLRTLRGRGRAFAAVAAATLASGVATCAIGAWLAGLPPKLAAGVFAGALTSTPGLAAAWEVLGDSSVAVGYGAAYPFGVVGVILFVQVVPRLLGIDLAAASVRADSAMRGAPITVGWFQIRNPQLQDVTIAQFSAARMTDTLISRVVKGGQTMAALGDLVLACGDHVRAVGTESQLHSLELLLGPRVPDFHEAPSDVASVTLVVTEPAVTGRSLAELQFGERFSATITRIWRDDFEIIPHGSATLEFGDTIRVVGNRGDCERVAPAVGHQEGQLEETQLLPLALVLVAGLLLGMVAIPLPGGLRVSLQLAGGPLIAGLVAGHLGRLGPMSFRIPLAAKFFIRELGLTFFLAGAGIEAGHLIWRVLQAQGPALLAVGAATTLVPMIVALLLARFAFHWDPVTALGAICGSMTSTPGLGVLSAAARSQAASLAYVAAYPAALIGVTILAPLVAGLVELLP